MPRSQVRIPSLVVVPLSEVLILNCLSVMNRPHCDLYEGVKLEVSLQAHNMRQVAHLIIAMQRMKNTQRLQGTEFSDQELLNIMMENASLESFYRCNVADQYQKSLVLNEEALELQAMTLQGGSFQRRVQLNLSMYVTPSYSSGKGQPVTLGIVDTNLYLSCSSENGMPILQLEVKVNLMLQLQRKRLYPLHLSDTFLQKGDRTLHDHFESARYQGWFISTALQEREPVEMCTKQEANRITSFRVK
uniref:Interleukin-1 n=1 Tax=Scleropages formosus TaxID=113540 RepID=A0A8C9SZR7_SCLFO